jgi:FMN-dependent oxidoreductase (nitrilotriacetate monooxygenase family)
MEIALSRQLKIGASIRGLGYNVSAWRHPGCDPAGGEKIEHYAELAKIAEDALFDMIFFADALAIRGVDDPKGAADRYDGDCQLEPFPILCALATLTKHVGLISTSSTSYNEPYNLARRYASLDHISHGRAGWNAVTSFSELEAQNFNREHHWGKEERYERANEFLEVVMGLWASWDKDALIRDPKSGIFADRSKVHELNHMGKYFQVRGPLTLSRTPQGRPLQVQAGSSEMGLDLAGRFADVVYSVPRSLEVAIETRKELQNRAAKFGRKPEDILSMPGIQVITGRTDKEARDKHQALLDVVDPVTGMAMLNRQTGGFLTLDMMDGPIPVEGADLGKYSVAAATIRDALKKKLTVRQLCQNVGMGGHYNITGTADHVTEVMASWFEQDACDGFNILPTHMPENLRDFAEHVVPRLQQRGLFRKAYEGSNLRENLGLPPLP